MFDTEPQVESHQEGIDEPPCDFDFFAFYKMAPGGCADSETGGEQLVFRRLTTPVSAGSFKS